MIGEIIAEALHRRRQTPEGVEDHSPRSRARVTGDEVGEVAHHVANLPGLRWWR